FCYPRIEQGEPTVCAETCVGRLRYIGLVLYDADRVTAAASMKDEQDLYQAQRDIILDPHDPEVIAGARAAGIHNDWIEAAQKSPTYQLIKDYEVALPLHPEYRTMPMVWYIPPLSPVVDVVRDTGYDAEDADNLFAAIDALRIPVEYLANLFTAGDVPTVERVLYRMAAMRSYMRDINLGSPPREGIANAVGMDGETMQEMYRLLAIAKYEARYVIPVGHHESAHDLAAARTAGPLVAAGGPGMSMALPEESMGMAGPGFATKRQEGAVERPEGVRINLLNWDGRGRPDGLFPTPAAGSA